MVEDEPGGRFSWSDERTRGTVLLVACLSLKTNRTVPPVLPAPRFMPPGLCWIVEPEGKIISVFTLQNNGHYGRPEVYPEEDKIKVSIFPDLFIDLNPVFANI